MPVALKQINSSAIDAHGYDLASRTLAIRFKSGRRCDYRDVPPEVAEAFAAHESAGKAFNELIAGRYDFVPVEEEATEHEGGTPD